VSTGLNSQVEIRPAGPADAAALSRIYNHYVSHTHVTFEEDPVTPGEMARRIEGVADAGFPWVVAECIEKVVGYAYACPWRPRKAYRFSAETTVYIDPAFTGRGTGSQLYSALLPALRTHSLHAVVGVIALPNDASIRLHERFGFKKVAHLEEIGFKFGRWIDVGYWELKL
jgi:L-amino acid N-acyltransferase YncA